MQTLVDFRSLLQFDYYLLKSLESAEMNVRYYARNTSPFADAYFAHQFDVALDDVVVRLVYMAHCTVVKIYLTKSHSIYALL